MPSVSAVLRWLATKRHDHGDHRGKRQDILTKWVEGLDQFQTQYARAREAAADAAYEQIMEVERAMRLPKKVLNPLYDKEKPELMKQLAVFSEKDNPDYIDPHTGRVLIDSIKWRASKLKPKVYGDRLEMDVNANIGVTVTALDHAPDWLKEKLQSQPRPAIEPAPVDIEPDAKDEGTSH